MDRKHPSNYEIIRKNKGYGKGDKVAAVRLKTSLRNPKNLREKSMNHHNVHKPKLLGGLLLHVRTGAPFRSKNTRGGMHTHAACG